jgi:hypothetical protein
MDWRPEFSCVASFRLIFYLEFPFLEVILSRLSNPALLILLTVSALVSVRGRTRVQDIAENEYFAPIPSQG